MKKQKIAIVAPAYNEEKHLSKFLDAAVKTGHPLYLVDDGSTDSTSKLASKHKVKYLKHKVNLGKGAAMKTGCDYAFSNGAKAVVFMDADANICPKILSNLQRL